jgi:putative flippase GtrA
LVAPVISRHSDVSIGNRFKDAHCGFKAMRADVARRLLPQVKNRTWFFDKELLQAAERAGLHIHELAVDDAGGTGPRADIGTTIEDLRVTWRLASARVGHATPRLSSQLGRFAAVGLASTLAYAAIFWILRGMLPATLSNSIALVVTAIANTAANRRLTFGVRGSDRLLRDHAGGLIAFSIALVLTNLSILLLNALAPSALPGVEIAVLTAVSTFATAARFLILRALMHSGDFVAGTGVVAPSGPRSAAD